MDKNEIYDKIKIKLIECATTILGIVEVNLPDDMEDRVKLIMTNNLILKYTDNFFSELLSFLNGINLHDKYGRGLDITLIPGTNNIQISLHDYKFIPIGWSAGCLLALYFTQLYSSQCIHVILLESMVFTPNNIKIRLKELDDGIYPITNAKYKKMLLNWKENHENFEDADKISNLNLYIRLLFFSKHLKLKLPVPTLAFFNIIKPVTKEKDLNKNKQRLEEIKILEQYNPENYKAIKFTNKSHYIFNMIQPAKEIIKQIKNIIIKST